MVSYRHLVALSRDAETDATNLLPNVIRDAGMEEGTTA